MLSLDDARSRWDHILKTFDSTSSLKQATSNQLDADNNPCIAGLRSVCWKIFFLYPSFEPTLWIPELHAHRSTYDSLCSEHLALIRGGGLGAPDIDPLADDEGNPWEQYRRDVELRAEIVQDVERCMPDIDFFRGQEVQTMLSDVLMVYCKSPEGKSLGYRQGLHEIAAVLLWVVWHDAVKRTSDNHEDGEKAGEKDGEKDGENEGEREDEDVVATVLDAKFIEHDAWALFRAVMAHAREWYEPGTEGQSGSSAIIAKSKYIHETLLMATDPELAQHLKALDVLPQVFLIRWVRLLFSREFPFDELLRVWDALFAEDTEFHLVDLICVAMVLRIRWQLLEADYSTALTLVLRYPSPPNSSPPATFVEDAIYLRENLSAEGGKFIIQKYSKRVPGASPSTRRTGQTNRRRGSGKLNAQRQRTLSPAKSWGPGSGLESIVQDVAKNVLDRSQRWGVNLAARGAVETRRSGFHTPPPPSPPELTEGQEELVRQNALLIKRIAAEEERQRTLARILEMGMLTLEDGSHGEGVRRLAHVKECLLDLGKPVDKNLLQPPAASKPASPKPREIPVLDSGSDEIPTKSAPRKIPGGRPVVKKVALSPNNSFVKASFKNNSDTDFITRAERPRATLAQSSFAWMLGDDPAEKNRAGFVPKDGQGRRSGEATRKSREGSTIIEGERPEEVDLGEIGKPEGSTPDPEN